MFAGDLQLMTGLAIATVGGASPVAGDIYLTLGATDTTIGDEGYVLTITDRVTTISSRTDAGAFYGTRTLLQLITTTGDGGTDTISFASSSARYVRMYSTAWNHNVERIRLTEFEIYQ